MQQQSQITIRNKDDLDDSCYFYGFAEEPSDIKHGYNEQVTIYAKTVIKSAANTYSIKITINYMDNENKEILRTFFKNSTRIIVFNEEGEIYSNLSIIGKEFTPKKEYEEDGTPFFTGSIEVKP